MSTPHIEPAPVEKLATPPKTIELVDLPRGPPPEIRDANTIYLAEATIPQTIHKYLACLERIQRQALVRALCSGDCAIELVERRDLTGVDLILDIDTAIVFLNLFSFSSWCKEWVDKMAKGSWKFDRLLIIFDAYNELSAKKTKPTSFDYFQCDCWLFFPAVCIHTSSREGVEEVSCGAKQMIGYME